MAESQASGPLEAHGCAATGDNGLVAEEAGLATVVPAGCPVPPHRNGLRLVVPALTVVILLSAAGLGQAGIGPLRGLRPDTAPAQPAGPPQSATEPVAPDPAPATPDSSQPEVSAGTADAVRPVEQANGDATAQEPPRAPKSYGDRPDHVRGLYLTGYTAGGERLNQLLALARSTGLNAMVIDAKDDDGRITFQTGIPLAKEIGANSGKIRDVGALIRTLEDNDIYPIARIVVFVDPVLSRARPDWAVRVGDTLWRDRRGLSWTNPNVEQVWQYNVEIAKEAARAGFREIQFDYVRFPEKEIPGYTAGVPQEQRTEAINGFLRYAREELKPFGVLLSADVFGLTTTVTDDMRIGQEYAAVAGLVDYISPMVYPSHYSPGNYGLANPNASPYETVYNSMIKAREKTPDLPLNHHRPWIQDFSLGVRYGKAEVEAQIRALAAAGIHQFLLWNPNNVYTSGVDYSLIDREPEPPAQTPQQPEQPEQPGGPEAGGQ